MTLIDKWTAELRYQAYDKWSKNYLEELTKIVNQSHWRLGYHIQPKTGLLNDPNGFSFFNGRWHLFYQAFPFGAVHGLKSWYHLSSKNLIDWQEEGCALIPDNLHDSHGVYSGSALAVEDKLFLAYTGNVRDENWTRLSYQMGAWLDQDNHIEKISKPLLPAPPTGYTQHFRDPQIFRYQEKYLLLIGAQNEELHGKILTYQSENLLDWQLLGELHYTDEEMGYMVECPNLIFIDAQPVLFFCPQGLAKNVLDYQNIYPNTYMLGEHFDLEKNQLVQPTELKNLDEGFDVYATQAFNAPDGRALAVSWIGLPEISYPTDQEGWAHCLSLVKELTLKNGKLLQKPVAETRELRQEKINLTGVTNAQPQKIIQSVEHQYELQLEFPAGSLGVLELFCDDAGHKFTISFDTINGKIMLNRKNSGVVFGEEFGTEREFDISKGALSLQIFVDTSVVEIFINNGEQTATARVFPTASTSHICFSGNQTKFSGAFWQLRKMK